MKYGKENDRVCSIAHTGCSNDIMDESAIGNEGELAAEQYHDTEKATTDPSPQSAVPNDVEESCKSAAERFVRVKSEGRSSDIFLDRIEPVKELLSDDLYQSLVPDLSKDELAAMRRESKRIKKEETTETQITSMDSAIDRIADDDFEVYVIYTAQMQHADRNDASRYLVRMRVQWSDGKAKIYKMIEESSLGHGFYEK